MDDRGEHTPTKRPQVHCEALALAIRNASMERTKKVGFALGNLLTLSEERWVSLPPEIHHLTKF